MSIGQVVNRKSQYLALAVRSATIIKQKLLLLELKKYIIFSRRKKETSCETASKSRK